MAEQTDGRAQRIGDRAYSARAVTAVSAFRWPGWGRWVRALFWFSPRLAPFLAAPLERLAFIHAGRWSVVSRLPSPRRPGHWERVRPGRLIFETNFDGAWRPYIEAFARVMPTQWIGIWAGTRGFPGPVPASGLLAHIERDDVRPAWYYSAHPDDSLRTIVAALELDARLDRFAADTEGLDDDAFATRWAAFVEEVQWLL